MSEPLQIDLNADLGEADSVQGLETEAVLLGLISSANVACGFHAGGPRTIHETVRRAAACGCAVGAHPSYPDRSGFGRRFLDATPDEIWEDVLYQLGAIDAFCVAEGVVLTHVKPHGALYNRAVVDGTTASAIAKAVASYDPLLPIYGLPGSPMIAAADRLGIPTIREGFADRAYNRDYTLVSRRLPGAMILDPEEAALRALQMVQDRRVMAIDGTELAMAVDTICLHGDEPGAVDRARAIRARLDSAGIAIKPPGLRRA